MMKEAYWFPVELLVIQAVIVASLELFWRFVCWKAKRNERLRRQEEV